MSEHEGYFRIGTTVGRVSRDGESEVYNNLYVLDTEQKNMPVVGKIENIAPGEQIYGMRFFGNRGYMITFKKVDPLFVIALDDPRKPQILGELKMPGYSTYLHLFDDDHLIGLGKDAEEAGTFAWFQGLKLALFDVSDESNPAINDEEIIGGRRTDSQALYDHHAFTFDRSSNQLAIPVRYYSDGGGGSSTGSFQYNGVHLFDVSVEGGIEETGVVELPDESSSPERTILMSDGSEEGMYILDGSNLYQVNLSEGHEISDQIDVPNRNAYDYYVW